MFRIRKLLLSALLIAFPIVAISASAQGSLVTVNFECLTDEELRHFAGYTATNHTDRPVQLVLSTIYESGARTPAGTGVGATIIQPGATHRASRVYPISPPYNGWEIKIGFQNVDQPWMRPAEWIFIQTYTEGDCSINNTNPDPLPTSIPQTPTPVPPTAVPTTAPTATLAPDQTPTPVPNSFTLVSAERMCADQAFAASWTGSNLAALEFSLTNTSDNWVSGWVSADPAPKTFAMTVDHHSYDKVTARAVFEDGTETTAFMDVGSCTGVPAPPQPDPTAPPAVVDPPASSSSSSGQTVSALPSTGAGSTANSLLAITALALIASIGIVSGALRRKQ